MEKQKNVEGMKSKEKIPKEEIEKYDYSIPIQRKFLSALFFSWDFAKYCFESEIIRPEYFDNPIHQIIVKTMFNVLKKHGCIPSLLEIDQELTILAEKRKDLLPKKIDEELEQIALKIGDTENFNYVTSKINNFGRYQLARNALLIGADKRLPKLDIKGIIEDLQKASQVGMADDDTEPVKIIDFLKDKTEKREIFVDNWVDRKGLTILGGREKVGKSLIVINLMIQLARGDKAFLDEFNIPKAQKVLYIQQEIDESYMQDRLNKMLTDKDFEDEQFNKNLEIINTTGNILKITDPAHRQIIYKHIEKTNPDLIVFDPLNTFHDKNENDNKDMGMVLTFFQEIAHNYNVGILIIHHYGKPSQVERDGAQLLRGASVLADRPDFIINMNKLPKKFRDAERPLNQPFDNYAVLGFTLRSSAKPNDTPVERDSKNLWFKISDIYKEFGYRMTAENINEAVKDHGGDGILLTQLIETIKSRYHVSKNTAIKYINEAELKGYTEKVTMPGKGKPFKIKLKKEGVV